MLKVIDEYEGSPSK
jgi:hypothetical protein